MPRVDRRPPARGVEWEFTQLSIPRDFSRHFVARLLTVRAEYGGWEVDRVRISADGTRRIVLRRKIIRQARPSLGFAVPPQIWPPQI